MNSVRDYAAAEAVGERKSSRDRTDPAGYARLVDDDVRQERDELCGSVSSGSLAEYLTGLGVERRVQGQRVESTRSRAARRVPARVTTPDPCGPALESTSSHPHRTPPHAPEGSDTAQ